MQIASIAKSWIALTGIVSDDCPMKRVESLLVRIFGKGE